MKNLGVCLFALLSAEIGLVLPCVSWAAELADVDVFDRAREEKQVEAMTAQVGIACAASGTSDARGAVSAGIGQRISLRMKRLASEIEGRRKVLDMAGAPDEARAERLARLDRAIGEAMRDVAAKAREYNLAKMYEVYKTVKIEKPRAELTAARARLSQLQLLRQDGGRLPASVPEVSDEDAQRATEELAVLADLSDRYQYLRNQASYCKWRAEGMQGQVVSDDLVHAPALGDPVPAGSAANAFLPGAGAANPTESRR